MCGLYDLNPAKRGLSDSLITSSADYGDRYEHWNGVDLSVQARLKNSLFLSGGISTGKTVADTCDVVGKIDNPSKVFCHLETPFLPQYKLGTSYTLPWEIQVAGTVQSFAGPGVQANATFTNAQVQPSLGRPLSGGVTVALPLLPGGTGANPANPKYYGDRLTQIDLRLGKSFRFGKTHIRAMLDIYNLANVNTVVLINNTYGPAWQQPQGIAQGRLMKIGTQLDF